MDVGVLEGLEGLECGCNVGLVDILGEGECVDASGCEEVVAVGVGVVLGMGGWYVLAWHTCSYSLASLATHALESAPAPLPPAARLLLWLSSWSRAKLMVGSSLAAGPPRRSMDVVSLRDWETKSASEGAVVLLP